MAIATFDECNTFYNEDGVYYSCKKHHYSPRRKSACGAIRFYRPRINATLTCNGVVEKDHSFGLVFQNDWSYLNLRSYAIHSLYVKCKVVNTQVWSHSFYEYAVFLVGLPQHHIPEQTSMVI